MTDDAELLRRYAEEKSEAAFAELVQRHVDLVYAAALRRLGGDGHGAADVAQRVFVALARQAAALARHPVLPAWLYATTRHVAIDYARAEQRRKVHEREASLMQELNASGEPPADWDRLRPLLDGAMDALPERDREAVLLRFFARRPFAEIGRALNLSEDAARMRVERAMEKLRELLVGGGITSTAAALGLALSSHSAAAAPAALAPAITSAALSVGPLAAAPATLTLQFMSTSKIVAGGAALLALLVVGTAVHEARASRAAEGALTRQREENIALAARGRELVQRATQVEADLAAREATGKTADRPSASVGAALPGARVAASSLPPDLSQQHPEVREAWTAYQRATARHAYRSLIRELNLTPAQIDAFTLLLVQGTVMTNWSGPDGKPVRLSVPGDTGAMADGLRALLGPEGFRRFDEFARQTQARNLVDELAGGLYASADPLSAGQARELVGILHRRGIASDRPTNPPDWPRIVEDARAVLSGPQLAMLQGFQAEQDFRQAYIGAMQSAAKGEWSPAGKAK